MLLRFVRIAAATPLLPARAAARLAPAARLATRRAPPAAALLPSGSPAAAPVARRSSRPSRAASSATGAPPPREPLPPLPRNAAAGGLGQGQPHLTDRVREASRATLQRYREMEAFLRWRGYNILGILATGVAGLGLVLYFYRDQVRASVSDELADVTRRTLQDDELKIRAHELTKAIVQAVLDDPNMAALASRFLVQLFNQPETKAATVSLLNNVG